MDRRELAAWSIAGASMAVAASLALVMHRGHLKRKRVIKKAIADSVASFLAERIEREARLTTFTDSLGRKHRIQGMGEHWIDHERVQT